ncbi:MAG: polynucleotide adenylyltransferase, partial [Firmicutes bacterium]|nr:polynucleotide adenylyltransferase [Bacillota bacterium]
NAGTNINIYNLPAPVREIMARLERGGFRSYLVGGVVRDYIQGRVPKDYDIATIATPDQVRRLFPRVIPSGLKHGTVKVIEGGLEIEVTTLRRDGRYSDCRRPDGVEFTFSLREDLSRRDFTINSLAADIGGRVYDFFGGLKDIAGGIIRAVGDPGKRFREDGLRMMRAIRFACQMKFVVESVTLNSIRSNRRLISRVSMERIRDELNGILMSEMPREGVDLLFWCGLMDHILPYLADLAAVEKEAGTKGIYSRTLDVLSDSPARLNVRLAALLHCAAGLDGPGACAAGKGRLKRRRQEAPGTVEEMISRLKYDRRTAASVLELVGMCNAWRFLSGEKEIKRFLGCVGAGNIEDVFDLWTAHARASGGAGDEESIWVLRSSMESILAKKAPVSIKDLALNGNDLKRMGIRPGRDMGLILDRLLEAVLDRPEVNERPLLMEMVREWSGIIDKLEEERRTKEK